MDKSHRHLPKYSGKPSRKSGFYYIVKGRKAVCPFGHIVYLILIQYFVVSQPTHCKFLKGVTVVCCKTVLGSL